MEVPQGDTYHFLFTTRDFDTGAPQTLTSGTFSVYEEGSATQILATQSLTADFDTTTGLNHVSIICSSGNGFDVGSYYSVVLDAGTVDGVGVTGEVIGHFRIMPPEDAGAGIKDVNVTHVSDVAEDIATETKQNTAQTDLDTITGTDGVTLATAQANNNPANAGDAMTISGSKTTLDALNDIAAGDVWAVDATTQQTQGTFGQAIGDPVADTTTIYQAVATDASGDNVGVDTTAIKAKTDQLTFTKANEVDANTQSINGATVVGDGNATPWDGA